MKRLIRWLADKFGVTIVRTEVRTVVKEKEVIRHFIPKAGTIEGDLIVEGDLLVKGSLNATGGVTCYKEKGGIV
mgnify:FL=1